MATPHISKYTSSYLRSEGVKTKRIPGNSRDFMPVENLFVPMNRIIEVRPMKRIIEDRPIKALEKLKVEARQAWRSLSASHLRGLIESMPNGMKLAN